MGARSFDGVLAIVSSNVVTSPLTGTRAAAIHIEVLEDENTIGAVFLGDIVTLARPGMQVSLVVRRAKLVFTMPRTGGAPFGSAPPEIVPLLRTANGRGSLVYRERALAQGASVHLRALIESTADERFVVRDDLGPAILEEVHLDTP